MPFLYPTKDVLHLHLDTTNHCFSGRMPNESSLHRSTIFPVWTSVGSGENISFFNTLCNSALCLDDYSITGDNSGAWISDNAGNLLRCINVGCCEDSLHAPLFSLKES